MTSIAQYFTRDAEGKTYQKVENTLQFPMFILGITFIPVLGGIYLADLSKQATFGLEIAGWAIWGAFAVEYFWLLYLAPSRWKMIRTHKIDLLVVAVPFLRPLRILRIFQLMSGVGPIAIVAATFRRVINRPGISAFFTAVTGIVLAGAGLVLAFEHEQPGASIANFGDAIWWSIVTCSTVGYGDHFPVTTGGRVIAVVLILVGISALSALTASIAALFVEQDDEIEEQQEAADTAELKTQLSRIEAQLRRLSQQVGRLSEQP